jgi:hypothetical protein
MLKLCSAKSVVDILEQIPEAWMIADGAQRFFIRLTAEIRLHHLTGKIQLAALVVQHHQAVCGAGMIGLQRVRAVEGVQRDRIPAARGIH